MFKRSGPRMLVGPGGEVGGRSRRYRPLAETLEGRRLLSTVPGKAALDPALALASIESADSGVGTRTWTPYGFDLQVGSGQANRLRVARATTNGFIGQATATIDWGDGETTVGSLAVFAIDYAPPASGESVGVDVVGEHTYQQPGTYSVRATIRAEDGTATTVTSILVCSPALRLSGALDPASDSGASNTDGITAATQPRFQGSAPPNATVQLLATRAGDRPETPLLIGQAVADAQGNWSIQSAPLAEGSYTVIATAFASDGRAISAVPVAMGNAGGPLVVDTTGPRLVGLSLDARTATLQLNLGDNLSGLDPRGVLGTSGLSVQRLAGGKARSTAVAVQPLSVGDAGASLRFGLGRSLPNGRYTLRLQAIAVRDLAGNALDGEFAGAFATGNGQAGGDFNARIQVARRQATAPVAVQENSTPTITRTSQGGHPGPVGRGASLTARWRRTR